MKFYNNLESFLFAYELGSFSKAGKKLNITQAAVSTQIKNLEIYLGKTLFIREGKYIKPTFAAKKLAVLVSEPFYKLRGAIDSFSKYTNTREGIIKIGCINEFAQKILTPKIGICLEHEIKLRVNYINNNQEVIDALQDNLIDFGITSVKFDYPNLKFIKLFDDELIFVGTERWKNYLDQTNVASFVSSLHSLRWLAYNNDLPFIKKYIDSILDTVQFIEPYLTFTDFNVLIDLVARGYGVACLPKTYVQSYIDNQSVIQMHFPKNPPRYTVYLVYKAGSLLNKRMKFFKELCDKMSVKNLIGVY
ncbi:LysR family transcriptional regulator [Legionella busanensis]|uniref:LysR family transcriptional regulator n=1 Tax=Legionella busanensis TaxID=190655 RepID=A0A378JHB8_9GAMM|nr:LysR family transcriptional regulator [Legionella busanensis]STX50191.1 LysR family transcriptional regulator [Legionella busanensis]